MRMEGEGKGRLERTLPTQNAGHAQGTSHGTDHGADSARGASPLESIVPSGGSKPHAAPTDPASGTPILRVEARATVSQVVAAKGAAVLPPPSLTDHRSATPPSAIAMIAAAVLGFTLLDTAAKTLVLGEGAGPSDGAAMAPLFVVWARFALHAVLVGAVMGGIGHRPVLTVASWPLQLLRSACLFTATMGNFIALQYLQLSETVAVFFVAPMVVTALAGPMLGEWVGWRRWLAIMAGFCGVLVMARPGTSMFQPALVFSIVSMLGYSFYVLLTRRLAATETPESLVFVSALVPALLLSIALPWAWTPPQTVLQWLLVLAIGLCGVGGHFLFVEAYRRASTGALAPFTYVQIPMMVFFGWLVFGNLPDEATWMGIAMIAAAGLYIVARERHLAKAGAEHGSEPPRSVQKG